MKLVSAEIGGAHLGIGKKVAALALQRDPASLKHVGAVRDTERLVGHLLHEKDSQSGLSQTADGIENVPDYQRCQPKRRFI